MNAWADGRTDERMDRPNFIGSFRLLLGSNKILLPLILRHDNNNNSGYDNAKIRRTDEVNKLVMRCFNNSDLTKRGYRKQIISIWKGIGTQSKDLLIIPELL